MRYYPKYNRIIGTKEKSAGNDTVGDMWTETKSFSKDAPISEIIDWAKDCGGRLMLTIDEEGASEDSLNF